MKMKINTRCRLICITLAASLVTGTITSCIAPSAAAGKARLATKKLIVNTGSKVSIVIRNKNKKAKYTYSSSKPRFAAVSKKGIITGRRAGSSKVTVKERYNRKTRKLGVIIVTVKNKRNNINTAASPEVTTIVSTFAPAAAPAGSMATTAPSQTPAPTADAATASPLPTRTPLVLDDTSTPSDFMTKKDSVDYGSREDITYHSDITGTDRHAIVMTPPDYDTDRKYPVLYLCHGGNGDENDWLSGKPDVISGNLLAENKTVPMIIVLVNCRARANDGANPSDSLSDAHMKAWTDFLYELQSDLMPYMQANYPVLTGRENTAIAGLSMGGRESLYIGFNIPDKIKYIGAFSPAFGIFEYTNFGYHENGYFTEDTFTLPDEYKDNTTCMIMNGANDSMVRDEPEKYHNALVNNGVDHFYYTIPGDHNMDVWSNGLYNFLKVVFR